MTTNTNNKNNNKNQKLDPKSFENEKFRDLYTKENLESLLEYSFQTRIKESKT